MTNKVIYFLCNEYYGEFVEFKTKQELIEYVGENYEDEDSLEEVKIIKGTKLNINKYFTIDIEEES